ncbi:MAG TPA: carboxypeptidase-like regulatory domain-containing protein [Candidatus Sulfotelmatobacter sp.]|nr:carboxypeptidase-like regulatory domain-containing protein [Candidatus Sulfotelmatobacter sp.]
MSKSLIVFAVSVAVLAVAVPSRAQSSSASLRGTIVDPKGAAVSGARVTLSDPSTGFARTVKTTDQGGYQFLEIPPSAYRLTIQAPGFAAVRIESIRLMVNTPATVDEVKSTGR